MAKYILKFFILKQMQTIAQEEMLLQNLIAGMHIVYLQTKIDVFAHDFLSSC